MFCEFCKNTRGRSFKIDRENCFRRQVTGYQGNNLDDDQGLGGGLWPLQIKAPMGRGKFGPHYPQYPLVICFSSYALTSLPQMSPSGRQPTVLFPPGLKGWLNSDPFWIDGATCSALHDETLSLFEGAPTLLEGPIAPSIQRLFPSFGDERVGYPSTSGDTERFEDVDLILAESDIPFGIHPNDLYVTLSFPPSPPTVTSD